jgi:tetratricopeptide (TPR) repeat protein
MGILFNRALLQIDRNQMDAAIHDLSQVLNVETKNAKAFFQRGQLFLKRGKKELAIQDFNAALQLLPDWDEAQKALAEAQK